MAGGKETPRQKMIGMMYLVLMAMLAMNVSKEVLDSFILIDNALDNTNKNYKNKIESSYNEFKRKNELDPAKVGSWYKKAEQVKAAANEMAKYTHDLRKQVIYFTQGSYASDFGELENVPDSMFQIANFPAKDDYDKPTNLMIGDPGTPKEGEWTALEFRGKLQAYVDKLNSILGSEGQKSVKIPINFDGIKQPDGTTETWENGNFYHIPIAAVATNLTRFEAEVRNAEADVLSYLLSKIGADDFSFDEINVKVLPKSNYVVLGDSFKADVIVAAYSTTQPLELEVGSDIDTSGTSDTWSVKNPAPEDRIKTGAGVASYAFRPTSEGEVTWGGFVSMTKPNGQKVKYPFKSSFVAAKASAVVSATKMNVFYRGLENPLSVSVSGFAKDKIQINVSNGSSTGSNGEYMVKPGKGRECKVTVSVKTEGGGVKKMTEQTFRVKGLPKPEPYFANITGTGEVSTGKLKISKSVSARLDDFLFDGVKYSVTGFELVAYNKGKPVQLQAKGSKLSQPMQNLLKVQRKGNRVFIQNIFAKGPDGKKRNIGNINLVIK